jgi:hypothetical protein
MGWEHPDLSEAFLKPATFQGWANATPSIVHGIKDTFNSLAKSTPGDSLLTGMFGWGTGLMAFLVVAGMLNRTTGNVSGALSPFIKLGLPLLFGATMHDYANNGFNDIGGVTKRNTEGLDNMFKGLVHSI